MAGAATSDILVVDNETVGWYPYLGALKSTWESNDEEIAVVLGMKILFSIY